MQCASKQQATEEGIDAFVARGLAEGIKAYLQPLLERLDAQLDKRLVDTLLQLVMVIVTFRNRINGLLLSELGGYLAGAKHAPAGTKRISNLLRSRRWQHKLISRFLLDKADERLQELETQGESGLLLWDDSELEKPESEKLEGLGLVCSGKAKRLTKYRMGCYNPAGRAVIVPGIHWSGCVLTRMQGVASLVMMRWWTNRGKFASRMRNQHRAMLRILHRGWARRVIHVFDRGFAGLPWLQELLRRNSRFILRWPKGYNLCDLCSGEVATAGRLMRRYRSQEFREVYDPRKHAYRKLGITYVEVRHPALPEVALFLVVARFRGRGQPCYLLTSEPLSCLEDAWFIMFAYARRWQVELVWRFAKSELAFESPRLWTNEARLKLLLIATLAFMYLIALLHPRHEQLKEWLLRSYCSRTGRRCQRAKVPLYRLRLALSQLWLAFPPRVTWRDPPVIQPLQATAKLIVQNSG